MRDPIIRSRTAALALVLAATALLATGLVAAPASAAPTAISDCQTLNAPGSYRLTTDLAAVDETCMEITAGDVTLDLAGHTMTCTGAGFEGSCQVPAFTSHGVAVTPGHSGVTIKGPGTIDGFDNGVFIQGSHAHVGGLTITGPPCDPEDCDRPISNAIIVIGEDLGGFWGPGEVAVNIAGNVLSNHQRGILLGGVVCSEGDASGCVLNGNTMRNSTQFGVLVDESSGYTLTRNIVRSSGIWGILVGNSTALTLTSNVVRSNGSIAFFEAFHAGGIAIGSGVDGLTIVKNETSDNVGWGIGAAPEAGENIVANNTARGNQAGGARSGIGGFEAADLMAFPGSNVTWNDNNRCHTSEGIVPASVCNPGE